MVSILKAIIRNLLRFVFVLLSLCLLYLGAAGLGALTFTSGDRSATTHILYLFGNSFHTDIIVPNELAFEALPQLRQHFADEPLGYFAFGWGSQEAYTKVGTVADLSLLTAIKAVSFDQSLMHVTPIQAGLDFGQTAARQINVTRTERASIMAFIAASFQQDSSANLLPLEGATHGHGDLFFKAKGRFSPLNTCNVWVGNALRSAGLPVGSWTPFVWGLP